MMGLPMIINFLLILQVNLIIIMASSRKLDSAEVQDMAMSNTRFMLDLLRQHGQGDDNVFFGPYSITTALAMTCMGAEGSTADEMKKVLRWTSAETAKKGFSPYLTLLQEAGGEEAAGYLLKAAQRIYVSSSLSLKPTFSTDTQENFLSSAKQADFVKNAEGERGNINAWVSDQTRGKIKDLLPSGSLNPLTAMVLVQALYFKGSWMHKFDAGKTQQTDFFSPQGKVKVSMMHQTRKFLYSRFGDLNCAAVELPYGKDSGNGSIYDLSMLILLPDDNVGLSKLEAALTPEKLQFIRSELYSVKVDLRLPRFKVESSFQLKAVLSQLGMPLAFSERADFSGMATGPGADSLYISEVFHKAVVEVNEEGTEAAAATAVKMKKRSIPVIHPFLADHPFLFIIIDRRAHVALFAGRVTSPQSADQPKDEL